jgi:hypothetical protein
MPESWRGNGDLQHVALLPSKVDMAVILSIIFLQIIPICILVFLE